MKEETFDQLQKRIPERIIEHAVRGMLPKGRVRHHLLELLSSQFHPSLFDLKSAYLGIHMLLSLFLVNF